MNNIFGRNRSESQRIRMNERLADGVYGSKGCSCLRANTK